MQIHLFTRLGFKGDANHGYDVARIYEQKSAGSNFPDTVFLSPKFSVNGKIS